MPPSTPALLALVIALAVAAPTFAQINSSPPPLMGERSHHLYSVPFAITGANRPYFLCTNTTDQAIRVGVEGFAAPGGFAINDASATSLSVPPSGTVLFGSAAVGLSVDSNPGIFASKGSARVLATASKGIICTAFLADTGNDPPTSMVQLNIVKKTKQNGD
jgi:hypothetical protein